MAIIQTVVAGGGSGATDEFANYVDLSNMIDGTNWVESTELTQACNDISQFLYGTNNN